MKVQNTVKKIAALAVGAFFLGATVAGASASLADYPAPFVTDGVNHAKIVIGDKAATQDVLGAVDIATSLQRAAVTAVEATGGSVSVAGGKTEDILVGSTLATAFGTIDSTDVPFLADSSVSIDIGDVSGTYDYEESVAFVGGTVSTGVTATNQGDDWMDKVFVTIPSDGITYTFDFKETLESGNYISDATSTDPINIEFLGQNMKIVGASDNDTITVQVGNEVFLNVGDTATVAGKQVKLVNVGGGSTDSVVVSVDGVQKTISGSSATNVNGIKVKIQDTFYSDSLAERAATLIIGDETTETYDDDEAYIGEDEDNPAWAWYLGGLATSAPTIGIQWKLNLNSWDNNDNPMYTHALYEGDTIAFPSDFAEVKFVNLNQDTYQNYKVDVGQKTLYTNDGVTEVHDNGNVLKITAVGASNSGLKVNDSGTLTKTEEVYLYPEAALVVGVYYKDSSNSKAVWANNVTVNDTLTSANLAWFDYKKTKDSYPIQMRNWVNATKVGNLTFYFASDDMVKMTVDADTRFDFLGIDTSATDAGLYWNDDSIADYEENTRTKNGVVIYDPDAKFRKTSGYLEMDVPGDVSDFRANIAVVGKGGSVASTGGTAGVALNPIALGMAILDKDASLGNTPYIVVGGPCANTVAASLMGTAADTCAEGFTEGKATIKLYADQNALLVAGYSAEDTQGASRVLADYSKYMDEFTGTELEVVTANLNSLSVKSV
ncbi:MAG: S-layer protein [archaeon]